MDCLLAKAGNFNGINSDLLANIFGQNRLSEAEEFLFSLIDESKLEINKYWFRNLGIAQAVEKAACYSLTREKFFEYCPKSQHKEVGIGDEWMDCSVHAQAVVYPDCNQISDGKKVKRVLEYMEITWNNLEDPRDKLALCLWLAMNGRFEDAESWLERAVGNDENLQRALMFVNS